eukprot:5016079-Amphidinium_carterae.1
MDNGTKHGAAPCNAANIIAHTNLATLINFSNFIVVPSVSGILVRRCKNGRKYNLASNGIATKLLLASFASYTSLGHEVALHMSWHSIGDVPASSTYDRTSANRLQCQHN